MKAEHVRETVRTLYESGKRKKEIARFLKIDIFPKAFAALFTV